jgi:hypothetical protein
MVVGSREGNERGLNLMTVVCILHNFLLDMGDA